jgi:hypothetical protein
MHWLYALAMVILSTQPVWAGASAGPLGQPLPNPLALPTPALPTNASLACRDFKGRTVKLVEVPDMGDAGRAEVVNSVPVIILDPRLLGHLPANLQLFFGLHECAHHVLGHLYAPTTESEKQADCWAIKAGRNRQAFTRDDVESWKPFFAASQGSRLGHLPGPARVDFLLSTCFENPDQ